MNSGKKLSVSIITLVIICICLCVTSFALGMITYEVRSNTFSTGVIEIDLNGGKPIITADEFLFEPGMTVEKPFYIKNKGTWAVYYKLFFSVEAGDLGEALEVAILDKEGKVLLDGTLAEMTKENVPAMENELAINEKQELTVRFHFPKDKGNEYMNGSLEFSLDAVAVQTKNNTAKEL